MRCWMDIQPDRADGLASQTVSVRLPPELVASVDDWIARFSDPSISRGEAIMHILAGRLGSESPSSVVPKLVTGRDIV